MSIRRFTRLTNAFSKKIENHAAAVALWFMYYNFCRVHQTVARHARDGSWPLESRMEHCRALQLASGSRHPRVRQSVQWLLRGKELRRMFRSKLWKSC